MNSLVFSQSHLQLLQHWVREYGFAEARISRISPPHNAEATLQRWLEAGYQGSMGFLTEHLALRSDPNAILAGTKSVITVRMNYFPSESASAEAILNTPDHAFISRYALGRDYHKVLRARLKALGERIQTEWAPHQFRPCTDSAPLHEVAYATQAGLGWQGKHSLLIQKESGSFFFLGELLTTLELPPDPPVAAHCGTCTRCFQRCPTQAILPDGHVDARRCISYLTIEHPDSIPKSLRPLIGNRIYGCDDCQLVCPWNRFAAFTQEPDFAVRHALDRSRLVDLFEWDEATFKKKMAGSAILRMGHERWLRNIAVALGNAPCAAHQAALFTRQTHPSALVREHVQWALAQQKATSHLDCTTSYTP